MTCSMSSVGIKPPDDCDLAGDGEFTIYYEEARLIISHRWRPRRRGRTVQTVTTAVCCLWPTYVNNL